MAFISLRVSNGNLQDFFIRHRNFLGEITPIQSELDRDDATFELETFETPDGEMLRFRSLNFPLHVLRHQDFRVKLHEFNPSLTPPPDSGLGSAPESPEEELLRKDSSFFMVPGLEGANTVSFRSLNFPDRFIRHRDFHLFVEPVDSLLARTDASFVRTDPLASPPPPPIVH